MTDNTAKPTMTKKNGHPTPREVEAMCALIDAVTDWCDARGLDHRAEDRLLDAVRIFCASGAVSGSAAHVAMDAAVMSIYPPANAPTPVQVDLRCMLLIVPGLVVEARKNGGGTVEGVRAAERALLTHASRIGSAIGHPDPDGEARRALDAGRAQGRGAERFPEPGFARQLALGAVIAHLRAQARFEPADLCRAVTARGTPLSTHQLGRLEAGNTWAKAPLDSIATVFGITRRNVEEWAAGAHALAAQLAGHSGAGTGERWFADTVAVDGRGAATAWIIAAAAAAVRRGKMAMGGTR